MQSRVHQHQHHCWSLSYNNRLRRVLKYLRNMKSMESPTDKNDRTVTTSMEKVDLTCVWLDNIRSGVKVTIFVSPKYDKLMPTPTSYKRPRIPSDFKEPPLPIVSNENSDDQPHSFKLSFACTNSRVHMKNKFSPLIFRALKKKLRQKSAVLLASNKSLILTFFCFPLTNSIIASLYVSGCSIWLLLPTAYKNKS